MTRIKRAMKEYYDEYGKKPIKEYFIRYCPKSFLDDAPALDEKTEVRRRHKIIGCRGITCEQCWNEEVKE